MKMNKYEYCSILLILFTVLISCNSKQESEPIMISDVWSRPVKAFNQRMETLEANGVVYCRIQNNSKQSDRLLSVTSGVADVVEIHESKMTDGKMTMRMLKDGLEIPVKTSVELKPGSFHIMLISLNQNLTPGDRFQVIFEFEQAGIIAVQSEVAEL